MKTKNKYGVSYSRYNNREVKRKAKAITCKGIYYFFNIFNFIEYLKI